jgi:DNA invertase Pin-like site-specific DNA recombinase
MSHVADAPKDPTLAVIYTRQSSDENVGEGKWSDIRQVAACTRYANHKSLTIVRTFQDPGVSGRDSLIARPGFSQMIDFCRHNRVGIVLIETGDRFARDLIVQELGLKELDELKIAVVPADHPTQFSDPSPVAALVRQMLGAIYAFVAAQIRERMQHGYAKAKAKVASDPAGRKSYKGVAKVGGKDNMLDTDSELNDYMSAVSKRRRINLSAVGKELAAQKPGAWCVMTGPRASQPWSAKQVKSFLIRFNA